MLKFQKNEGVTVKDKQQAMKDFQQASDDAIVAAQALLTHPDFKKYRERYQRLLDTTINALVNVDAEESDAVHYGFRCKDIVSKFRTISDLLRAVEQEANRNR